MCIRDSFVLNPDIPFESGFLHYSQKPFIIKFGLFPIAIKIMITGAQLAVKYFPSLGCVKQMCIRDRGYRAKVVDNRWLLFYYEYYH